MAVGCDAARRATALLLPLLPLLLAGAGGASAASAGSGSCSNTLKVDYPAPVAASGWSYRLVANGFTKPRGIVFDKDGGLLVVDSGEGLVHLTLKDEGSTCLSVGDKKTLISDKQLNHGLALSDDGKTVYVSSADKVFSYGYDSKAVTLDKDSSITLVSNMSNSDHTTRTLLLSRKKPGTLLVSRGSQSNEDDKARELSSGHSQIRSFDISGSKAGEDAYDFMDGHVIGWGLRNSVGVAEDPATGGIWSVENSVDQLSRKGKDIHQDNPAEELNYHGVLGSDKDQGGNYGYPMCYAVWSTKGFPELGALKTADQFPDDDADAKITDKSCNSDYVAPRLALQAHTAPLDIRFNAEGSKAFVAFHGSWNRENPVGYRLGSLSFKDGQPTANKDSTDAITDILSTPDLSECPDRCFRPAGLAWDSKGRLWLTSDSTGEIFVLEEGGSNGGGGGNDSDSAADQLIPNRAVVVSVALAALVAGVFLS